MFGLLHHHLAIWQHPIAIVAQIKESGRKITPTAAYRRVSLHGFTVLIHPKVLTHSREAEEIRAELSRQLVTISRSVPAKSLSALKKMRIWGDQYAGIEAAYNPAMNQKLYASVKYI